MRTTLSTVLWHGIALNPALCCVQMYGQDYHLTQQEYLLLEQLLRCAASALGTGTPVRPLSRGELLRGAWGSASDYETRTVDVHIQRLRAKFGHDLISTVYRKGYCINPDGLWRLSMAH